MRKYKYNEIEYAKQISESGFQTKHKPTELRLLVLYYRDVLGYNPKQREEALLIFLKKHYDKFSLAKDYVLYDKTLKKGCDKKQKLVVVDQVPITKSEFEYINALDISLTHKKVLFSFLVQNKLNKAVYEIRHGEVLNSFFFSGGNVEYKEIKDMSKIPIKTKFAEDILHELITYSLIKPIHTGVIELEFLKNINPNTEVMFFVKNYEVSGLYFEYYSGDSKLKLCANCGSPYYPRNNKHKFCNYCKYEHEAIYKTNYNYEKKCKSCGEMFTPMSNSQRYCDKCKDDHERHPLIKNADKKRCAKCGRWFFPASNRQIYCKKCSGYNCIGMVERICVDCERPFKVDSRNTNKVRCKRCQKKYKKIQAAARYADKKNNSADDF